MVKNNFYGITGFYRFFVVYNIRRILYGIFSEQLFYIRYNMPKFRPKFRFLTKISSFTNYVNTGRHSEKMDIKVLEKNGHQSFGKKWTACNFFPKKFWMASDFAITIIFAGRQVPNNMSSLYTPAHVSTYFYNVRFVYIFRKI